MAKGMPLTVFTFRVNDLDATVPQFGCTAPTLELALVKAAAAGHDDVWLEAERPLAPDETDDAATARILENPMLGPAWLPLVEAVEHITETLHPGEFWAITTYPGFDPHPAPWAQAVLDIDGEMHLEVCPSITDVGDGADEQYSALAFLGWSDPRMPGVHSEQLPLPYRRLQPGWNGRSVADVLIEALALACGVAPSDRFSFGELNAERLDRLGVLTRVNGGPIFELPAVTVR
jgi:hypothetical protein